MRTNMLRIVLAAALVAGLLVLVGCPTEVGVSKEDRVGEFQDDLNKSYANAYKNWHPDTNTYQAAANPATLEQKFPSTETYEFSNVTVAGTAGTATLNSTLTYSNSTVSFVFKQDGDDWFFASVTVGGLELNAID